MFFVLLRRDLAGQLVTRKTDLVIEGFPRSGNTFSEMATQLAQGDNMLSIASHLHMPAHVARAVRLKKPCLVVIHRPLQAIASMLVYYNGNYSIRQAIREYIEFYEQTIPFRSKVMFATFKEIREDFGRIMELFNTFFDSHLILFDHTEQNEQRCFEIIEQKAVEKYGPTHLHSVRSAKPTHERTMLKRKMIHKLSSEKYADDLARATAIFKEICAMRDDQYAKMKR